MTSHKYSFVTLLILLLVSGSSVSAQSDRGAITGRVTAPAGAVVPQAKVTVTNLETNESRDAVTSDEGNFTVPQLPAAMYKITVEAPGFKTATLDNIKVAVQITRTADIKLEVGAVGEVVNVSGEAAPVLQTDTPVQQLNVSERQVRELPLLVAAESGGRSPLSFIFLDSSIVSNDTPLMALFWLATRNVAVDNEKIRNAFQPVMEVVPAPATIQKYIYAEKNGVYVDSLAKLQKALADVYAELGPNSSPSSQPTSSQPNGDPKSPHPAPKDS